MAPIKVLLQYGGEWVDDFKFINYKADGILLKEDCSYTYFLGEIVKQLGVDTSIYRLEINYQIEEGYQPISVKNDMGVQLYVEQKKLTKMSEYPLCITTQKKVIDGGSGTNSPLLNATELMHHDTPHDINIPEVVDMIFSGNSEVIEGVSLDEVGVIDNPEHDYIEENQVFKDKETLQSVMKNYSLREKFDMKVDRSSSTRYSVICVNNACSWMMRSSSLNGSGVFMVRKFIDVHSCPLEERLISQRRASSNVIGNIMKDKFSDPKRTYTPNDIIKDLKKMFGVEVNYMQAWRSKEKAIHLLRGDPSKAYGKIPSYLYVLNMANPGSVTRLQKEEDGSFLYAFVALYAFIAGWQHCRPVVVVDGSFLSGPYGGTMITACTLDASGHILPLAYAVVDSENNASWEWFFRCLREAYGLRDGMCIVSDRHESIARAARTVYPEIPHCVCVFHLWTNIKLRFKKSQKKLKDVFFSAAMAYTIEDFDTAMKEVESIDSRVKDYLFDIGYHRWSIAHAVNRRTFFMTSNIAESVNAANKQARRLPILALMEYMTDMFQMWTAKNRQFAMETFTSLGEKFQDILNDNIVDSKKWTVIPSTDLLYAVVNGQVKHIVDLREKTCTCGRFQLDEVTCQHTIAALEYMHVKPAEYCSDYYKKNSVVKTYDVPVYPTQGESAWKVPEEISQEIVLPPHGKKQAGRPTTSRIKSSWERPLKRARISCARCGHQGHNRKTCRNAPMRF